MRVKTSSSYLVTRSGEASATKMSNFYENAIKNVLNQTLYGREALREKFGWEEYVIFALMLAVSAGIGVYFWWRGQYFLF